MKLGLNRRENRLRYEGLCNGLSRMKGNFHVRFLGEGAAAMPLPYPTFAGKNWGKLADMNGAGFTCDCFGRDNFVRYAHHGSDGLG